MTALLNYRRPSSAASSQTIIVRLPLPSSAARCFSIFSSLHGCTVELQGLREANKSGDLAGVKDVLNKLQRKHNFEFWGFIFVMLAAVMSGLHWCMTQILPQVLLVPCLYYSVLIFLLSFFFVVFFLFKFAGVVKD